MFTGYYDFILNDFRVKPQAMVKHHCTCPICDRKLVNVYYSYQLDVYLCKICSDKLLEDRKNEKR